MEDVVEADQTMGAVVLDMVEALLVVPFRLCFPPCLKISCSAFCCYLMFVRIDHSYWKTWNQHLQAKKDWTLCEILPFVGCHHEKHRTRAGPPRSPQDHPSTLLPRIAKSLAAAVTFFVFALHHYCTLEIRSRNVFHLSWNLGLLTWPAILLRNIQLDTILLIWCFLVVLASCRVTEWNNPSHLLESF